MLITQCAIHWSKLYFAVAGSIVNLKVIKVTNTFSHCFGSHNPVGGGTPYNGLYGEALPKRGNFFRLQVYKRVGKSVRLYQFISKALHETNENKTS